MANLKLNPIIRGTDWATHLKWQIEDATGTPITQQWADYELDCHFKTEQGTDKVITVVPTLSVFDAETLQVTLDELQTQELPVGVLYFNLLATKSGWTQQVIAGTVMVNAGVTTP